MVRLTVTYSLDEKRFSRFQDYVEEYLAIKKLTQTTRASSLALGRITSFFNNPLKGVSTLDELEPSQAWYHARDADIRHTSPEFYMLTQKIIEPYTLSFSAPFTTSAVNETTLSLNLQSHYARALHAAKKAIDDSADTAMLYDAIIDHKESLRGYRDVGAYLTHDDTLQGKETGIIAGLAYHLLDAAAKMTRYYYDFIGIPLETITSPKNIIMTEKESGFKVDLSSSDVSDILHGKSGKEVLGNKQSLFLPYKTDLQRIANQYL